MEYTVLALVVIVTIAAHVWIYRWVRFKMDEGVVLRELRDAGPAPDDCGQSTEAIARRADLRPARVGAVCRRSKDIVEAGQPDCWRLERQATPRR